MWGRDIFSYPIALTIITNYNRSGVAQIWTLLVPVHHAARRSVLWNGIFYTFISSRFSESVTSEIHRLVASPFFGKDLKFNLDLKNEKKNKTKSVVSEIIASEFAQFLLKREYFSRALNPLTNSFKTLHISKRHFFQPNCLNNDQ